jgi:hypothetical protein
MCSLVLPAAAAAAAHVQDVTQHGEQALCIFLFQFHMLMQFWSSSLPVSSYVRVWHVGSVYKDGDEGTVHCP